ncbi:carboxylate--amine ligase [Chryseobacterium artocarpi]|uniref:Carboxylate--amine ligase n=1 Tax=Chryseobacterium artocarpi TaxID=1414727 RepID=A0A1B8ZC27_9FLAO|nr:ATP-grasp domain-containing protein [Chryseobacterium artocarpi]OCA69086.1 carboxylate--amine ligase [Chryseobacterium artocarpi]
MEKKVAILFQAQKAPSKDNVIKPMKDGGYSDSGADIAYSLNSQKIDVLTPKNNPNPIIDKDWVFPDNDEGIFRALEMGANVFWLNTVLYRSHAIEKQFGKNLLFVGQNPNSVDSYDDKILTNKFLRQNGLNVPSYQILTKDNIEKFSVDFSFPSVIKPVRGRGSQGVYVVKNETELKSTAKNMFKDNLYGDMFYLEEFLSGQELTISVMPPGKYFINGKSTLIEDYWSLPPVERFNHENGVAPYNGIVAIIKNSKVISSEQQKSAEIVKLCRQCEAAAHLIEAKAPIRIDCRADEKGVYYLFDLNMKPNMTGSSRLHRRDQDSLTALAAREIGWSYDDLILNMLNQAWTL